MVINAGSRCGASHDLAVDAMRTAGANLRRVRRGQNWPGHLTKYLRTGGTACRSAMYVVAMTRSQAPADSISVVSSAASCDRFCRW